MFKVLFSCLLFVFSAVLISGQDMQDNSMEAKYKTIYNTVLNALTSGNTNELDKYVASNVIEHDPSPVESKKTGLDRIKEDFAGYHKIFPDMKAEVHNIAVSGNYLFAYITFTGTTSEPAMGMPANHKMTMNAVDLIRFENDKVAEHWGFTSNEDIMKVMMADEGNMKNEEMDKK